MDKVHMHALAIVVCVLSAGALAAPFYTHFEARRPSIEYGLGRPIGQSTPVAYHAPTERVYVAVVSSQSTNHYPVLYVCNSNGKLCSRSLMNGGVYESYQATSSFSMGISTFASAVYGAAIRDAAGNGAIRVFKCTLEGTGCIVAKPSELAGFSPERFSSPSWTIDTLYSRFVLVATNRATGAERKAWAFFCDLDVTACSAVDVSGGRPGSSLSGPGTRPSVHADADENQLWVLTTDTFADAVVVTICNLLDGTSCEPTVIFSSPSSYSLGLRFDPGADHALIAVIGDQDLGVGFALGSYCPPRNVSGCAPFTSLGALTGTTTYNLDNFATTIDTANSRVLVTSDRLISSSVYSPIGLFECDFTFTACDFTYDIAAELPGSIERWSSDGTVPLRAAPGISKMYFAFISDDSGSAGEFILGIASPDAPRLCPDTSLANGAYTYELDYPHWTAVAECNAGYGRVGFDSIMCLSGATEWSGTPPTCVFNATSLLIEFPAASVKAGRPFEFWITDSGASSSSDPGSSLPTASVGGVAVPVTLVSYEFYRFTGVFDAPTTAGPTPIAVGLNGNLDAESVVVVEADTFAGSVLGASAGELLQLTALTGTMVEIDMVDQYGNVMLPVVEGANASVTADLQVTLEFGTSVKQSGLFELAPRPDAGFNVVVRVVPDLVVDYDLHVLYQGVAAINSPVRINVTCPLLTVRDGTACVSVQCSANSINVATVGSTVAACQCLRDFYVSSYSNGVPTCSPCPSGAVCLQGTAPPFAAEGFFTDNNATFVRCKRPAACRGGVNTCSVGYTGYMCNTCAAGFYSDSKQACTRCPPSATPLFVSLVVGVVVAAVGIALLVAVALVKGAPKASSADEGSRVGRVRSVPASISMVLVVLQVLGILSSANFAWSSGSESALGMFNAANLDLDLLASACTLNSFHAKYALSLLIPATLLACVFGALAVFKVLKLFSLESTRIKTLFDGMLFAVAPLLYIPISRSTFVLFDCSRLPNATWVLDADPGVACFDDAWWGVFPVGVAALVIFVLGVPVYFLASIVVRRHKLLDPATFAKYGSIYKLYRLPYYWGGVADLAKRLAIVVAAIFVSERQVLQIGLLLSIFLTSLVCVVSVRPYYYPLYNELDARLTLVLIVVLLLGGASYAERSSQSEEVFLFVVLLITLGVFAVVALHAVSVDLYQIVRARKQTYSTETDRKTRLAAHIDRELRDLDPRLASSVSTAVTSSLLDTTPDADAGITLANVDMLEAQPSIESSST